MKPVLKSALTLLLVLSLTGLLHAERQGTVYMTDGTKIAGVVKDDSFGMRTDYGTLKIPVEHVEAMYPGFRAGTSTHKRIDDYISRLAQSDVNAIRQLKRTRRLGVPQLQEAAKSDDKAVAKNARDILKEIWPTGAKVPSDGRAILRTPDMEFRGTLTFQYLSIQGGVGRKKLNKSGVRLVQFASGKAQPVSHPPVFAPNKGGRTPEFELIMHDGSRIRGTIDAYSVDVQTRYGKLRVPTKDIISVKLGDPDEFVTRRMSFTGKLSTTTIEMKSRIGRLKLDRDKVTDITAVLDKTGTTVVTADEGVKPNQWVQIFDGKTDKGWRKWGSGQAKLENGELHLSGDAGMTYSRMSDSSSVILAALIKLNRTQGQGGGVKICVCDGNAGSYFVHFTGSGGQLFKWDNKTKKSVTLSAFQSPPARDGGYALQLYRSGPKVLAYVNGKEVANVNLPKPHQLPGGKVSIGVWNADASFKDIRVKVLK